jgi:pyruvate/2-oxoglutarate dehydrogenase complex dihydrolipoamide acyltransferase (E2) component
MPALGESVTEGTVTRWLKQEGDTVEVDEPLLEVSTDKVDTEIPSPAAGVLTKIIAKEDDVVEIGGMGLGKLLEAVEDLSDQLRHLDLLVGQALDRHVRELAHALPPFAHAF